MVEVKQKEAVGRRTRVVRSACTAGVRCDIEAGNHTIVTDEPPERGGMDEAPPPLYHLTAALAACQTVQIVINVTGHSLQIRHAQAIAVLVVGVADQDLRLVGRA